MRRPKDFIIDVLTTAFLRRDWALRSIARLPKVYCRQLPVTPYFYCSYILRRPNNTYVIDGAVGIIYQTFEEEWLRDTKESKGENRLCAVLHIANIRELSAYSVLQNPVLESAIDQFSLALSNVLESMPQDEASLFVSFKSGKIAGRPLDSFSGFSERAKFDSFKQFVNCLPKTDLSAKRE